MKWFPIALLASYLGLCLAGPALAELQLMVGYSDGIPNIWILPSRNDGLIPAGYNSPDAPDSGADIFAAYADPDVDKFGIFINTDGATIGNFFSLFTAYDEYPLFIFDVVADPHPAGLPFAPTAMQAPAMEIVGAQGNSSTWTGTGWNAGGDAFEVTYFTDDETATMEGVFWIGQVLNPQIDPADLYQLMTARYRGTDGELHDMHLGIPEPSTYVLLVIAAVTVFAWRRRKQLHS